ncbi:hypothetical protein [Rubrivivax sp. JA1026]|uniref:hypothetical protein n=1 Tax=Rubrivivax sp. JA1026 TaxID=2710888 RepID=UPI0013E9746E|nr:hypothetical protein [Rubrivivax sp. JA1026]
MRFQPDGWLEGLLRPLVLADPSSGIYFEQAAPDWRFAFLGLFVLLVLLARRGRFAFTSDQGRTLLLLLLALYVWTFVRGNGRYFAFGLLLVGPLLVVVWRRLPGTHAFRASLLALLVGMQAHALYEHYIPNVWGLSRWRDGPGLAIEDSPLRHEPAVFLTATGISYSVLVPAFDQRSRWANISGQVDIVPGMPEYSRLQELLASRLPRYLVAPISFKFMDDEGQPLEEARQLYASTLARYGLGLSEEPCTQLRSNLAPGPDADAAVRPPRRGFWICRVVDATASAPTAALHLEDRTLRVFAQIEARCPRFFPPGSGRDRSFDGLESRHYGGTDMRLYRDSSDRVMFRYFRAVNTGFVGTGEDILSGRFELPCNKMPGRYRLPWAAD